MPSVHDRFSLATDFEIRGDQVRAIPELIEGLNRGDKHQVLLGVTGSGKTFTMAQVVASVNRPTLVMAHNKTLAAQLYQEFKRFFPGNAVEYFVSYYDYYQPEAYVPATDSYIEKEATINDEIDRMRLSATRSLFERRDVIIVASVSCIYGLGSPEAYYGMLLPLEVGQRIGRDEILRKLVEIQYERNDTEFGRGAFRVRGDIVEVVPSYEEHALRIGLFGDEVDELAWFDALTGKVLRRLDKVGDPWADFWRRGAIPVAFHWVLALFLLVSARRSLEVWTFGLPTEDQQEDEEPDEIPHGDVPALAQPLARGLGFGKQIGYRDAG